MRAYLSIAAVLLLSAGCQKAPAQSANPTPATSPTQQGAAATTSGQAPAPGQPSATPGAQQAGQPPATGTPGAQAPGPAAQPAPKPVPAQLPEVLARVNGEAINRAEFEKALKTVEGRAGRQVPPEQRDQVYRNLLDQLVTFHVLQQEVKARNVTVTDQEVPTTLATWGVPST